MTLTNAQRQTRHRAKQRNFAVEIDALKAEISHLKERIAELEQKPRAATKSAPSFAEIRKARMNPTPAEQHQRDQEIKQLGRRQEMYRAVKDAENKVRRQAKSARPPKGETDAEFNKRVSALNNALALARRMAREEVRADAEAANQRVALPAHISRIDRIDPTADPDIIEG
jgi:hypothetical protein